jgi:flagellum-specific peptidoglycan hydrolase FlgJ
MGRGNWATDPDYATKILAIFQRMLTYAQQQS